MTKKLNTTEKKLKFHCSVCFTVYQLLETQQSLKTNKDTKCLNNCQDKWEKLLTEYCQEQLILSFTKKEQQKDEKEKMITNWLNQIKKNGPK